MAGSSELAEGEAAIADLQELGGNDGDNLTLREKLESKMRGISRKVLGAPKPFIDKNVRFDKFAPPVTRKISLYVNGHQLRGAAHFDLERVAKIVDHKLLKQGLYIESEYNNGSVLPPGLPFPGVRVVEEGAETNGDMRLMKIAIAPLQANYANAQLAGNADDTSAAPEGAADGGAPCDFVTDADADLVHLSNAVLIGVGGAPSSGLNDDDVGTFLYEVPPDKKPGMSVVCVDPKGIAIKFVIPDGGYPGAKLLVDCAPLDDFEYEGVDYGNGEEAAAEEETFVYQVPEGKVPGDAVITVDPNGVEVRFVIPEGGLPGAKLGIPCAASAEGSHPRGLAHMMINQWYPKPVMGVDEWQAVVNADEQLQERLSGHTLMGLLPPVIDESETKYRVGDTIVWKGLVADVLQVERMWPERSLPGKLCRVAMKILSKLLFLATFAIAAPFILLGHRGEHRWYTGTLGVNEGGTWEIDYDDGEKGQEVSPALIRALERGDNKKVVLLEGMKVKARKKGEAAKSPVSEQYSDEEWAAFPAWKQILLLINNCDIHLERKMPQKHQEWGILVRFRSRSQEASAQSAMYPMAMYETPGKSLKFPLIARRNFRYLNALGEARAAAYGSGCAYFYQDETVLASQEAKPYTCEVNTPSQVYTRVLEQVRLKPGYAFKVDLELSEALEEGAEVQVKYTDSKSAPKSAQETRVMYAAVEGDVTVIDRRAEMPSFLEVLLIISIALGGFNGRYAAVFSLSLSELVKVYLWKLNNLLQLTLGMWSKEVIDNYRISAISEAYHVSHPGDDEPEVMAETNMSILNLVGETYTMIYYFFPPLVALAQLGAASNVSPLHISETSYQDETLLLRHNKKKKAMRFIGLFKDDPEFLEMLGNLRSKEAAHQKRLISDPEGGVAAKWRSESIPPPAESDGVQDAGLVVDGEEAKDIDPEYGYEDSDNEGEPEETGWVRYRRFCCQCGAAWSVLCCALFSPKAYVKAASKANWLSAVLMEGRLWAYIQAISSFASIITLTILPGQVEVLQLFAIIQFPAVISKVVGTLRAGDMLGEKYRTALLEAWENILWLCGGLDTTAVEFVFIYLEAVKKATEKAKRAADEAGRDFDEETEVVAIKAEVKAMLQAKNRQLFSCAASTTSHEDEVMNISRVRAAIDASSTWGRFRIALLGCICARCT